MEPRSVPHANILKRIHTSNLLLSVHSHTENLHLHDSKSAQLAKITHSAIFSLPKCVGVLCVALDKQTSKCIQSEVLSYHVYSSILRLGRTFDMQITSGSLFRMHGLSFSVEAGVVALISLKVNPCCISFYVSCHWSGEI